MSRAAEHEVTVTSMPWKYNKEGNLFALCDEDRHPRQPRVIGKILGKSHPTFAMMKEGMQAKTLVFDKMFLRKRGNDVQFDDTRKSCLDYHKHMSPDFLQVVASEVQSVVSECCEHFRCVLDGWVEGEAVVLGLDLLVSIPAGSRADVEARAQDVHNDLTKAMYELLGKAHSLFITGKQPRTLRVCNEHGQLVLVVIPAYSYAVLHGRCAHGGWGVESTTSSAQGHTNVDATRLFWVLFGYVLMRAPRDVHVAEEALRELPEVVDELTRNECDPSLDWP